MLRRGPHEKVVSRSLLTDLLPGLGRRLHSFSAWIHIWELAEIGNTHLENRSPTCCCPWACCWCGCRYRLRPVGPFPTSASSRPPAPSAAGWRPAPGALAPTREPNSTRAFTQSLIVLYSTSTQHPEAPKHASCGNKLLFVHELWGVMISIL